MALALLASHPHAPGHLLRALAGACALDRATSPRLAMALLARPWAPAEVTDSAFASLAVRLCAAPPARRVEAGHSTVDVIGEIGPGVGPDMWMWLLAHLPDPDGVAAHDAVDRVSNDDARCLVAVMRNTATPLEVRSAAARRVAPAYPDSVSVVRVAEFAAAHPGELEAILHAAVTPLMRHALRMADDPYPASASASFMAERLCAASGTQGVWLELLRMGPRAPAVALLAAADRSAPPFVASAIANHPTLPCGPAQTAVLRMFAMPQRAPALEDSWSAVNAGTYLLSDPDVTEQLILTHQGHPDVRWSSASTVSAAAHLTPATVDALLSALTGPAHRAAKPGGVLAYLAAHPGLNPAQHRAANTAVRTLLRNDSSDEAAGALAVADAGAHLPNVVAVGLALPVAALATCATRPAMAGAVHDALGVVLADLDAPGSAAAAVALALGFRGTLAELGTVASAVGAR